MQTIYTKGIQLSRLLRQISLIQSSSSKAFIIIIQPGVIQSRNNRFTKSNSIRFLTPFGPCVLKIPDFNSFFSSKGVQRKFHFN